MCAVLLNVVRSLVRWNRSLGTEICRLPCHQQSNNQPEETENGTENLNDKNLDESVKQLD